MAALLVLHDRPDENDLLPVLRMVAPGWQLVTSIEEVSEPPVAFAYGGGADRAAEMLLSGSGSLVGALLLRPSGFVPAGGGSLNGVPVAVIAGHEGECDALVRALSEAGAQVDFAVSGEGRSLTPQDFSLAKQWLAALPQR